MGRNSYQDFKNILSIYRNAQRIHTPGSANVLLIDYGGDMDSFVKKFEKFGMNVLPSENGLERKLKVMTISATDGVSCGLIRRYQVENFKNPSYNSNVSKKLKVFKQMFSSGFLV